MSIKEQIICLLDLVPEGDLSILLEVVRHFALDELPERDDIVFHREAVREYNNGETVSHEDIDWGD